MTKRRQYNYYEPCFNQRASGASEAFSLVMKSNNCLRIRVLPRNACLHLAYMSPLGKRVHNWRMQLAPPTLGYAYKISCAYHPAYKSIKSLDGDRGMDRCHYAVPFKSISIRSKPEIVLSSKQTNNYKKAKIKGGLSWMTTIKGNELARFLKGTIFLVNNT